MAIYHFHTAVGSRSGGQSAAAKTDYILREGPYGRGDRSEVVYAEHGHMPEWAQGDPRAYWAAADEGERANGRLYREVEFALPRELTEGEQVEAAREFAGRLTGGERLPHTLVIHRGEGENPHCHLVLSERSNDGIGRSAETWFRRWNGRHPERGGARKSSTASRDWLLASREAWAETANRALERAGKGERVDHRPLAEQAREAREAGDLERAGELTREPGRHLGPGAAIEAKYWEGRRAEPSRAAAEALEIEDRNRGWGERWESLTREWNRVQAEITRLAEELRAVEREIRKVVDRLAARARGLADGLPSGQTERGPRSIGRRILRDEDRDRNRCR